MDEDQLLPSSNTSASRRSIKPSGNEILKAYQVNGYKYVSKKYENVGRVGVALLGTKITNNFNILLYGKGNVSITQANVNSEFEITSSEDLYVSFYDIKSENWSLRFDSMELFLDFLIRICIYKMISLPNTSNSNITIIDVKPGTGTKAQESNWCEIELTISAVKNCEIASSIYSTDNEDLLRTQIGSNKLMLAIEKGLIGMSKGGCRVIGVPSKCSLIKGGAIAIPTDTNLLVYVKLVRMKAKATVDRPSTSSRVALNDNDSGVTLPDLSFGGYAGSADENSEMSTTKKKDLMTKMIRLGRPIPSGPLISAEPFTSLHNISSTAGVNAVSNDESLVHPSMHHIGQYNIYDPNFIGRQQQQQLVPVLPHQYNPSMMMNIPVAQTHIPIATSSSVPATSSTPTGVGNADFTNMLFTETRQNNTEMRFMISKVQEKIDKILDRIDTSTNRKSIFIGGSDQQSISGNASSSTVATRHMDAENVFENIRRIINENDSLKTECSAKSDIIDKQNRRINDMLRTGQSYLDDSRDVIEKNSVSFTNSITEHQRRILQLEEDKLELIRNLSQKTAELSQSEQRAEQANTSAQSYRSKSLEMNELIDKLTKEIGDLKLTNRSTTNEIVDLKTEYQTALGRITELELIQHHWTEQEATLQSKIDSMRNTLTQSIDKVQRIQSECDAEIDDVRRQCTLEVDEWKTKLKLERQRITVANSDLQREVDQINEEWKKRLDDYRQNESLKNSRLTDKNDRLARENDELRHDVAQLNDRLAEAIVTAQAVVTKDKIDDWKQKYLSACDQLRDTESRLNDQLAHFERKSMEQQSKIESLVLDRDRVEREATTFRNLNVELQTELVASQTRNQELITMGTAIVPLEPVSQIVTLEESVKKIMNDVFRHVKQEFNSSQTYLGKEVVDKCLHIIRDATIDMMSGEGTLRNTGDEDEDEDEEDEEEEDEEEEEKLNTTKGISNVLSPSQLTFSELEEDETKEEKRDNDFKCNKTEIDIKDNMDINHFTDENAAYLSKIDEVGQEEKEIGIESHSTTNQNVINQDDEDQDSWDMSQSEETEFVVTNRNNESHYNENLNDERESVMKSLSQEMTVNNLEQVPYLRNDDDKEKVVGDPLTAISADGDGVVNDQTTISDNDVTRQSTDIIDQQTMDELPPIKLLDEQSTIVSDADTMGSIFATTKNREEDKVDKQENENLECDKGPINADSKQSTFSSDDDEDVMDFFKVIREKSKQPLSQQATPIKVEKPSSSVVDVDDDLSWLNN